MDNLKLLFIGLAIIGFIIFVCTIARHEHNKRVIERWENQIRKEQDKTDVIGYKEGNFSSGSKNTFIGEKPGNFTGCQTIITNQKGGKK